ncbi:hypothetical protein TTHERM_001341663 (macronuclear) [Tetrahymena thermophila SB210]|uniref:Uncharacterized protein n=1 Tax=Tetrahymena thermophila (strain SB210) TaxID=312017 RepID=W7X3P2_TETTS|nr:hypothetical protein TTHERM_001341663 [Tetrahymena thermophila SB210]EWS71038.1 hypothetical protein TTHERM_001341663 [Tetrahymena thermophila SB210]|eukprot:XP_012656431.1 hypothetical protein TTHERM_001341663 [Tetrahymena thermophila SB210]
MIQQIKYYQELEEVIINFFINILQIYINQQKKFLSSSLLSHQVLHIDLRQIRLKQLYFLVFRKLQIHKMQNLKQYISQSPQLRESLIEVRVSNLRDQESEIYKLISYFLPQIRDFKVSCILITYHFF